MSNTMQTDAKKRKQDDFADVISIRQTERPYDGTLLTKGNYHPKIVCFGDSLTQRGFQECGWCQILANSWIRKCDIMNRGFSGYTTEVSKLIVDKVLSYDDCPKGIVSAAIILLGSNDASRPEKSKRAVPIPKYKQNLLFIIKEFLSLGLDKKRIILVSPPPVNTSHMVKSGFSDDMTNEHTRLYADECERISEELEINNINLWKLMQKDKNWEDFLIDGLHFSRQGNKFLADEVFKVLGPYVDSLPHVYPLWSDIDFNNPESVLA